MVWVVKKFHVLRKIAWLKKYLLVHSHVKAQANLSFVMLLRLLKVFVKLKAHF